MDFNVAYEMFINTLSDFTLELNFNKQPLVKVWYDIKKEYPELSGKMIQSPSFFAQHVCTLSKIFKDTLIMDWLWQKQCDSSVLLSPDIEEIYKPVKPMPFFSQLFFNLENIHSAFFSLKHNHKNTTYISVVAVYYWFFLFSLWFFSFSLFLFLF